MAKRKSRYTKIAPNLIDQTCAELRKEFPERLIAAFVALHDSDYNDDKLYRKYSKESAAFLGDKAADLLESGKLLVRLTKATFDMVKEAGNEEAEGKAKAKNRATKAKRSKRNLSALPERGSDEGPEEGTGPEEVQGEG
jgi:hypothetical protein